jgi:hypothetical protein
VIVTESMPSAVSVPKFGPEELLKHLLDGAHAERIVNVPP